MNYIWEALLKADKEKIPRGDIKFIPAEIYSPYIEVALEHLNSVSLPEDKVIEVNQYYRFYEVFKDLFNINVQESREFREVLLDILLHYLGELDLKQGLNKTEIYKRFLYKDILNEVYGEKLAKDIRSFDNKERDVLLNGFVTLYKTGTSIQLLKKIIKEIFKNSIVYLNKDKPKSIYIYLDEVKEKKLENKIEVVLETFLPINMEPFIFWDKHFGIIGLDYTMRINEIVMVE
ncbi:hypothetical protein B0P06_000562 [Clostridium saccharoperbutylacetonicum]|uniref:Iron-dependent peroxidase n=1 Tax=Clostridium saccharoperbutylacetonicum N1-4(HMT) TaxID=931276 RepID=M1LR26_9CLOT|nr:MULTISPECIES: hypothetical protein [Clostridium]AGF55350.1 hypothetical protein Cspa_c15800 [Clostridium saccharoperbutylacetonicum N1-4(HMT)]NRT63937.1 hypothetical protein [Clostridium saccharoperbutylacetonicum]NSB27304.1 hypothetical protein [Clostridium saccharoperbutylacetonicum]NSB40791.1 hypothetical protein [Clostridium saccharoperbutylacetonicum]